ncbi:adenylate kinase 8-like, partial [Lycorma delicatula]|uniref:adenylate kinase 8-like n=1 Tax=Lycorma delicatula TaxID=130591 RepID=UPI003F516448
FQELCVALIKERPDDTITFLKNELLNNHVNVKIVPRKIIFIAPAHMALKQLANHLAAAAADIIVIPLSEIVSEYAVQKNDTEPLYNPEDLAKATSKYISKKCRTKGWILVDFPRTRAEAKALQRCGILPTHTLEFVHDPKDLIDQHFEEAILRELDGWENEDSNIDEPITAQNRDQGTNGNQEWAIDGNRELVAVQNEDQAVDWNDCIVSEHDTDSEVDVSGGGKNVGIDKNGEVDEYVYLDTIDDLWNKTLTNWSYEKFRSMMIDYRRRANDLREVYKNSLKTIIIRGRTLEKIVSDCKITLNRLPIIGLPMLFRIVLIGLRGSKRRTIASMLSKQYKIVHVHFWTLLQGASTTDESVAEKIRLAAGNIDIDLGLNLLEARLLESDCMRHGWVLTGFPNDETDFQGLDTIKTPPNRIIFLQADRKSCMDRLLDRGINMYSGEIMSKKTLAEKRRIYNQLLTHPSDCYYKVAMEQEILSSEIQDMLDCSGDRGEIVNATGSINEVFERVENVVVNRLAAKKKPALEHSQSLYNDFLQMSSIMNLRSPSDLFEITPEVMTPEISEIL